MGSKSPPTLRSKERVRILGYTSWGLGLPGVSEYSEWKMCGKDSMTFRLSDLGAGRLVEV